MKTKEYYGDLWGSLATSGNLWVPMVSYGDLLGPIWACWDVWGVLAISGHLKGPGGPMMTFSSL